MENWGRSQGAYHSFGTVNVILGIKLKGNVSDGSALGSTGHSWFSLVL